MKILVQTEYPVWFLVLCIVAGLAYAATLYFKNDFSSGKSPFSLPNLFMAILRFIVVSLISFFLLSPFIQKQSKHIEKPIIVIATDNSKSIPLNKDSIYYKNEFQNDLVRLSKEFSDKFELQEFSFGDEIKKGFLTNFQDNRTNISELLEYIYEQNFNRNLGAVILLSDGNYNEGKNPIAQLKKFNVPFYTIALGDTTTQKDIFIKEVKFNTLAYLGNTFPIHVKLNAKKCARSKALLKVIHKGKILIENEIVIENNNFTKSINFMFEAKEPGLQKYIITVSKLEDEISYANNTKVVFIDVLENRKSILILGNSPHPDIAAIKRSIKKNDNYKVHSELISDFNKKFSDPENQLTKYDLLILHQIPGSKYNSNQLFEIIENKRIPVLFILGTQSSIRTFNSLDLGLTIVQKIKGFNNVSPILAEDFNYFNVSENTQQNLREYPPVTAPFGQYQFSSEHQVALTQKIGHVNSKLPLLAYIQNFDNRIGILCGEGFWKWPLIEFRLTKAQKTFDELINKTIQFLSIKADKRFFRLKDFKNIFSEDQPVIFEAEVYNKSFEKLKNARINLQITSKDEKTYEYIFKETEIGYHLNAGYFQAGKYNFKASTSINASDYSLSGEFSVKTIDIEYLNTSPNHSLLYTIAKERNGEMFYPMEIDKLIEKIKNSDIKSTFYYEKETKDLIEYKWLLFLLVFLLTTEWFFRKFFGSY